MTIPASIPKYSAEEYLALERAADFKSEYIDGEIVAMAGTSHAHSLIVANLVRELGTQLVDRPSPCEVHGSDLRVRVGDSGLYTYPDVTVVCGEPEFVDEHTDTLANPIALFEVLSPSTAAYDRGEKFVRYRRLASLRDYVIVSQAEPWIEHFTRRRDSWILHEYRGLDASFHLPAIDCGLTLARVYRLVTFADAT